MIHTEDLIVMLRHLVEVLERQDPKQLIDSGDTIVHSMSDPEQEKYAFLRVSYTARSPDDPDRITHFLKDIGCELVYDKSSCEKLNYIARALGVKL